MPEEILQIYLKTLMRKPLLISIVIVIYILIGVFFIQLWKSEGTDSSMGIRETFATDILNVLDKGDSVENISEKVQVTFNSYDRKANGKLTEYGLVNLLEDTFVIYAKNKMEGKQSETLMALIAKQKEKDPYYGLHFEQEVIIKNLEKSLKVAESSDSLNFIEEIKEIVRRQNVEIDELKKNNRWGMPIGLAGVSFTLTFGLLGLSYPLIKRKLSKPRDDISG